MEGKKKISPVAAYLIPVLGVSYGLGLLELLTGTGAFYRILAVGFTAAPVTCAAIARRLTGERFRYPVSLRVWRAPRVWAFSALAPALLIAAGAAAYFLLFPAEYSGVLRYGVRFGTGAQTVVRSPLLLVLVCVLLSAAAVPIQLLELGEEIGWRGWLLGLQTERYGERKAALVNGLEWGLAHLPLIWFGFNYSLSNPGAPWSNMLMMLLLCLTLGVVFSYVTVRTGNCMYAAIMHGVVNVIGELPVFLTHRLESGLLGPNPTGLVGMSFLILLAAALSFRLKGPGTRERI